MTNLPTPIQHAHQVLADQPHFLSGWRAALQGIVVMDETLDELTDYDCEVVPEVQVLGYITEIQAIRDRVYAFWASLKIA